MKKKENVTDAYHPEGNSHPSPVPIGENGFLDPSSIATEDVKLYSPVEKHEQREEKRKLLESIHSKFWREDDRLLFASAGVRPEGR